MNVIRIVGLASVSFAPLVEPALAGPLYLGLLQGLVCLHLSLSAAHIGWVESFLAAKNKRRLP